MAKLTTTWEQRKPFNRTALELWTFADGTDSGANLYDVSGKGRDLSALSGWALQSASLNGVQTLYNDGTKNPFSATANFVFKHAFLVIACEGATFNAERGLLSGITSNIILTGANGTDKFNNPGANFTYKKSDAAYLSTNAKAPMNANFAIIEITHDTGLSLNSLQIGQETNQAGKKFKGYFAEIIVFSLRKGFHTRMEIYKYFAEKYHLFRELADGTKIFPFPNDHVSPFTPIRYKIQSPALPSGKIKTRTKGSKLQQFDFNNTVRRQDEIDAVDAFETAYFDGRVIAVENNSFYPPRRVNIIPVSDVSYDEQGVNLFSYKWSGRQSDTSVVPVVVDFNEQPYIDNVNPSASTLSTSGKSASSISYSWTAATDNIAVTGYEFSFDGVVEDVGLVLTKTKNGLLSGTSHTAMVRAYDANGNRSAWSNIVTETTALVNYALTSTITMDDEPYSAGGYDGAATNAIDGNRLFSGTSWDGAGGGHILHSGTAGRALTIILDLGQSVNLKEINIFTTRDSASDKSPLTLTETFSSFGITAFKFSYWNGSVWADISGLDVTGNNNVWRQFLGLNTTTTKIKLYVSGWTNQFVRITEIEIKG